MNAFEKIIGYKPIKDELLQICDMIHNRGLYEELGAKLPQGVLLYGYPGLGKTLMAKCFIEECGLRTFTLRKNKGGDGFVESITETFAAARENAPSIVFLDDMDKFANEDDNHCDADEYVAVQAGIDDVKGCGVFVIATVNEIGKLPRSLRRTGRFDRSIEVDTPSGRDARAIVEYYLADKKVSPDVDLDDITMMMRYSSCAELETILNEAAVRAGYARKESIGREELVESVLRMQYNAKDDYMKASDEEIKKSALHEAGHLTVCEALMEGSVGLASLRSSGRSAGMGFIHRCKDFDRRPYHVLVSLAGKAAVELYYADTVASGCMTDLHKSMEAIRDGIATNATLGMALLDVETQTSPVMSENQNARSEAVVHAELERYMLMTKDILLRNRAFLEAAAAELEKKGTLLRSDIRAIRERVGVVPAAA